MYDIEFIKLRLKNIPLSKATEYYFSFPPEVRAKLKQSYVNKMSTEITKII